MMSQRHNGTAASMIQGNVAGNETCAAGHPTTAEVVYRIATMTAVIFLLATVV